MTVFIAIIKDPLMDSIRYDIYFTGKLVEGHTVAQAQQQFAQLFKMAPEKASQLFTGKPQLIKRDIDKAQALKYKQALRNAGMQTAFKATQQAKTTPTPATSSLSGANQQTPNTIPVAPSPAPAQPATLLLSVAPIGSDVLNESERQQPTQQNIDTSAIKLASPFSDPEPSEHQTNAIAPDTSHLSVADSGVDILEGHHAPWVERELDLSNIELAPVGAILEQLNDEQAAINPDVRQMSIAEPGADLIENQPEKTTPPAPDTDHLSLEQ